MDINGCFSGDEEVIKGQIFTRLKKTTKQVNAWLADLDSVGLIVWYQLNGDQFLHIPDFQEKQPSLNPSKEAEPTIPMPTPEQLQSNSRVGPLKVKESKGKQSKEKEKGKGFQPPTLEEIEQQIKDKGYKNITAERFFQFYGKKGWMVGKNKMVDWKLALGAANNWDKKPTDNQSAYAESVGR